MKKVENYPIDVVITWVDSNDLNWQKEREKYLDPSFSKNKHVGAMNRYQDQGTLQYIFRGIEKHMPWVRKVFLVTCGHYPVWLNLNYDKLVLVKHEDFIPKEYLPTFNSNSILINLHRIKSLSEHFIYFNDDMYVVNKCDREDFFKNGLPRDMALMEPIIASDSDPFWDMMINNLMVINRNFDKKESLKKRRNWFSCKYTFKSNIKNFLLKKYRKFPGFYDAHIPNAHLKSVFEEVWNKEFDICNSTSLHKFRNSEDITEWTMRYWQLASNKFVPINKDKLGCYSSLKDSSGIKLMKNAQMYKLICLNDETSDPKILEDFFNKLFPQKSSFEK